MPSQTSIQTKQEVSIFPIPIQTNKGVVHIYCKNQRPIIGTMMTKSRHVVIIVTETKKYCGFLSEKIYDAKNYMCQMSRNGTNYFGYPYERGTHTTTEEELIKYPSERAKPFNLYVNNDVSTSIVCVDYVSFPKLVDFHGVGHRNIDNNNSLQFIKGQNDGNNSVDKALLTDLTIKFKLKVYEYDNYDQETEMINENTFERDPKLEFILKKLWKVEQGIENIPLKSQEEVHDKPPKYDEKDLDTHPLTRAVVITI